MIQSLSALALLHAGCAALYLGLAVLILARRPSSRTGMWLACACLVTAVWSGTVALAAAYGLLYTPLEAWHKGYGWRGMLILGVLPALAVVWIRMYVKEPEVWAENKRIQNATQQQASLPLFAIFKRGMIGNTLTACWFMASAFITYYWAIHLTGAGRRMSPWNVLVPAPTTPKPLGTSGRGSRPMPIAWTTWNG